VIAWGTDVHLDFLEESGIRAFAEQARGASALVLSGDISVSLDLERHLHLVGQASGLRPLVVLGNHDFYGGDIADVRARITAFAGAVYLPSAGVQTVDGWAVVGVDGWGDARLGNTETTPILLNDFLHIQDLRVADVVERNRRLRALGDAEADKARTLLGAAVEASRDVLFVTHVPPFREACWHEGQVSDDDWLPFFTCAAVGEVLRETARAHREHRFLVLCGHTHGAGECRPEPNLEVRTGGADYGAPTLVSVSPPKRAS